MMAAKHSSERPIAIDLFAGAGGLSLGFEQAGFDVVAAVEYDPIHAAVHELNFPDTTVICADVRDLGGDDIRERAGIGRGAIDVVIGGPPCQGFSLIGHRVLEDPRNSLVFHFLRLVEELRPRFFVMENVPGMATGEHHALLDELIERFGDAGYRVRLPYEILNAASFGVPQNRRRLFLIGARNGSRLADYPAPVTTMRRPAAEPRRSKSSSALPLGPSVKDALSDLPDIETDNALWDIDEFKVRLRGGSHYAKMLRGDAVDPKDFSYPRLAEGGLSGCLRARHTSESRKRFRATTPGTTEPISRFYRLPPNGVSNTLRAGTASDRGAFSAPRPIHPLYARCISVREAARLHSYPDWFRFHRTIWHGFRQIGNSVPPLLGRAVGGVIMDALGKQPIKPSECLPLGPTKLATLDMTQAANHFGVSRDVIPTRKRLLSAGAR